MSNLDETRTPGAQTGRSDALGIKITTALVSGGWAEIGAVMRVLERFTVSRMSAIALGRLPISIGLGQVRIFRNFRISRESAPCAQPCHGELTLPHAHDHQHPIGAHDRSRRTATTHALGGMVAQRAEVVLDVGQGDLAPPAVEHIEGEQLGGLGHTHGTDRRPAVAWMWPNTPWCPMAA